VIPHTSSTAIAMSATMASPGAAITTTIAITTAIARSLSSGLALTAAAF
jgi:hypothetical protein